MMHQCGLDSKIIKENNIDRLSFSTLDGMKSFVCSGGIYRCDKCGNQVLVFAIKDIPTNIIFRVTVNGKRENISPIDLDAPQSKSRRVKQR